MGVPIDSEELMLPISGRNKQRVVAHTTIHDQSRSLQYMTSHVTLVYALDQNYETTNIIVNSRCRSQCILDLPSLTTEKKSIDSCKWTTPTMTKLMAERWRNCRPLKADGL